MEKFPQPAARPSLTRERLGFGENQNSTYLHRRKQNDRVDRNEARPTTSQSEVDDLWLD
jgi:hypothetical protein